MLPLNGLAMGNNPRKAKKIQTAYENLDLSDGVSKKEAIVIAKHFIINENEFAKNNARLNSAEVEESGLVENAWAVGFDAKLKYRLKSGLKWFTVDIDKNTGEIKVVGWGPS